MLSIFRGQLVLNEWHKNWVVGNAPGPFLYKDGVMYDRLPVTLFLKDAIAINNNGQIAGTAYVLTPAPNRSVLDGNNAAPVICELGTVAAETSVQVALTVRPQIPFSLSGNLVYEANSARVETSNTGVKPFCGV